MLGLFRYALSTSYAAVKERVVNRSKAPKYSANLNEM